RAGSLRARRTEPLLTHLHERAPQVTVLELATHQRADDLRTEQRDRFGVIFGNESRHIEVAFLRCLVSAERGQQLAARGAADQRGGRVVSSSSMADSARQRARAAPPRRTLARPAEPATAMAARTPTGSSPHGRPAPGVTESESAAVPAAGCRGEEHGPSGAAVSVRQTAS